ncbi:MAG TPA: MarR family transcriptional regulator [Castellaniella sp.]|nr:MarR family transcriptional regulator [Castellaniella sp.]
MDRGSKDRRPGGCGLAFLLAQLGGHAAMRFGERVAGLGLTPPDAGVLRKIAADPGISQQALAEHLGVLPSRMVALIDNLEHKRLVERVSSLEDRRSYALRLTAKGQQMMADLGRIAMEHERDLCTALDEKEQTTLVNLCKRIADQQGLTPGVHPGYRQLGAKR